MISSVVKKQDAVKERVLLFCASVSVACIIP